MTSTTFMFLIQTLEQWFLKCGLQFAHQHYLGDYQKCKFSGSHPKSTKSETLRLGPVACVMTSPPGDSDAHYSLRTPDLVN